MATADQTIRDFCSQLAAGTPAPGGGAAAAVSGAMGAALVAMVAGLTIGREKFAAVNDEMVSLAETGNREISAMLACADEDMEAFNQVMAAFGMPKATDTDKAARTAAIQAAYVTATEAPLKTMEHAIVIMRAALAAAHRGNPNALSDAYVAHLAAGAAFEGALWNVAINLGAIKNAGYKDEVMAKVARLRQERVEIGEAFTALTPDPIARYVPAK